MRRRDRFAAPSAPLRSRSAGPWSAVHLVPPPPPVPSKPGLTDLSDVPLLRDAVARVTEFVTLIEQSCSRELAAAAEHISTQQKHIARLEDRVKSLEEEAKQAQHGAERRAERRAKEERRSDKKLRGAVAEVFDAVRECERRVAELQQSSRAADEGLRQQEAAGRRLEAGMTQLDGELHRLRDGVAQQSEVHFNSRVGALREYSGDEQPSLAAQIDQRIDPLSRALSGRLQDVAAHMLQDRADVAALEQRTAAQLQRLSEDIQSATTQAASAADLARHRADRVLRCCRAAVASLAQTLHVACPSFTDALTAH